MIATAAPIQKMIQCGSGTIAMPPMMNPMTTTVVPTQEMGLPGLWSAGGGRRASA